VKKQDEPAMLTQRVMLIGTGEEEEGVPAEFRIWTLLGVMAVEPASSGSGRAA
jgi:hypothetical protein